MAIRADKNKSAAQLDGPRALRPEERRSALELINSSLRPNGPPTILKEYPLVLGKENLNNMRVIVKGGEVLSHAAVYFSKLRSGDAVFEVGGVGSVATHSEYRGRGLASAVIRDCVRIMKESRCHLSVLWTQRHDFYRNLGYEAAGSEYLFRARASDFAHVSRDCKVVPYSRRRLPAIIEIHERETLRTERTRKQYETYLGIPKTKTLLAMRGNTVTAYAVMGKGEDFGNCIHESGGDAGDLLCLAREFTSLSSSGEIMILVPAQENEFTRLLRRMRLTEMFEYLAMMRIIDLEGLSSLLHDCLSRRLGGDFRVWRSQSGLMMKVGGEEAEVEQEQKLVRVLFGPEPASSLLRGFSHETLCALDGVLPIPLFIWGLDSV
jgi:GNAT superfamily N-acetyltransferase